MDSLSFLTAECSVALEKPSGAVQFEGIGAEKRRFQPKYLFAPALQKG